ncbi:hypothetical protein PG993_005009 [Apiospora rasikravindrae]|uniref:GON domain-containing protein n=1 Tax=Apiospora rasikravindrae TaxID=990691 RepID=A0ABR1TED9_9PEZI
MAKLLFLLLAAFMALVSGLPALQNPLAAPVKVASPGVVTPLPPQYFQSFGSQKVQITFGPFTVGNESPNGIYVKELPDATKPCTGSCYIYTHRAVLTYVNGTEAHINTGSMLKRSFISTNGRKDSVCTSQNEIAFLSANERLTYDLSRNGTATLGYLLPDASMDIYTEILNYNAAAEQYNLVLEFEFVPSTAAGFRHLTPYYLDSSGVCGPGMLTAPPNTPIFDTTMPGTYALPKSGLVWAVGGHLEDGGINLQLTGNGATLCASKAGYGETPSYVDFAGTPRISSMGLCFDVGNQTAGDQWSITGHYDLTQHPALPFGNNPAPVVAAIEAFVLH